jgi:cobalt-zinc-cadmium efflux system membrane fusion protein
MKNKFSRTFAAAVALTAIASIAGCSKSADQSKASATASNVTLTDAQRANIHLYTVEQSRFHKSIETAGIVDFDNEHATSVVAPFGGPVSRLLVAPGDYVKKGAGLAVVDSPDFAAAIGAYRKAIFTAGTTRRLANMDKDLLAHQGVAQREADQAQTDAVSAEADRNAALQTLASLGVDQQTIRDVQKGRQISRIQSIIRAPISGTVAERLITPGELLQAGSTAAFTIADLSRVWVMAQAFGSDIDAISLGDPAEVMTGGDSKSIAGSVTNIATQIDPDTRSVAVRVAVDNPAGLLKKQMYVRVRIQARQESSGLLIPVSAILHDDENLPFVYVVQRDGSFARAHVTLGYRSGDRSDITGGLQPGERIVADGALFIQFMQSQ